MSTGVVSGVAGASQLMHPLYFFHKNIFQFPSPHSSSKGSLPIATFAFASSWLETKTRAHLLVLSLTAVPGQVHSRSFFGFNRVPKTASGYRSDRAPQDSRLRSQKGGFEFINFPNVSFRSVLIRVKRTLLQSIVVYLLSWTAARIRGQLRKRHIADREIGPELKNREISFLTRILGRMTV